MKIDLVNNLKTVLVTATFYKDTKNIRVGLTLETIKAAKKVGYPIYIVDGSPDPKIRTAFEEAGAVVVKEQGKGMGASRRQCFQIGLDFGADIVVWLEPEKYPFVPLVKDCVYKMACCGFDILVPRRRSLESYPKYQALSEHEANLSMGISSGFLGLDWMFGPRVLNRKATELFLTYTGQAGGDTYHILNVPILWTLARTANARGLRVGANIVDYIHPPLQTAAEMDDPVMNKKRDEQRYLLENLVRDQAKELGLESLH